MTLIKKFGYWELFHKNLFGYWQFGDRILPLSFLGSASCSFGKETAAHVLLMFSAECNVDWRTVMPLNTQTVTLYLECHCWTESAIFDAFSPDVK